MNPFEFEEILKTARKRKLDEHTGVVLKSFTAKNDFEFQGHRYIAGSEYELSEDECRELYRTNQIELKRGVGLCNISSVKRTGKEMLYAYRSWRFDPPAGGPKDPFDEVMIRVRINKPSQVIIGLFLRPGDEFFMPYSELRKFEFDLETDPAPNWIKTLTMLEDQE